MVCKMMKRGVVGAALGAGALALLFGTAAPSYVRTAFHCARQSAKDNVPVEFEIARAKQQLADLTPAILKCTEDVARAEIQAERLQDEVVAARADLDRQGKAIVALRSGMDADHVQLASGQEATPAEIKRELARRYDRYKGVQKILGEKEETLRLRKQAVEAAREQLVNMKDARQVLQSKIEGVEAKLRQIEAAQAASELSFDDSALSRLKDTVSDLEERVEVMDRVTAAQAKLIDRPVAFEVEPGRDIAAEVDAEFGQPAKGTASTDKNL